MNMKKWLLGLGSVGAVVAPLATVVSCFWEDDDDEEAVTTDASDIHKDPNNPNANTNTNYTPGQSPIVDSGANATQPGLATVGPELYPGLNGAPYTNGEIVDDPMKGQVGFHELYEVSGDVFEDPAVFDKFVNDLFAMDRVYREYSDPNSVMSQAAPKDPADHMTDTLKEAAGSVKIVNSTMGGNGISEFLQLVSDFNETNPKIVDTIPASVTNDQIIALQGQEIRIEIFAPQDTVKTYSTNPTLPVRGLYVSGEMTYSGVYRYIDTIMTQAEYYTVMTLDSSARQLNVSVGSGGDDMFANQLQMRFMPTTPVASAASVSPSVSPSTSPVTP